MPSAAERIDAKLRGTIEKACKALVLEINKELRKRGSGTPVDTGHARANWIPSIGTPNTVEAIGTGDAAYQAGVAQVLSFKLGDGVLYITNVVPYVRRLNNGWSTQAPALFVEACVLRAMQTVKAKMGVDLGMSSYSAADGSQGSDNLASAYSPFDD